jgi:hypothetical protein
MPEPVVVSIEMTGDLPRDREARRDVIVELICDMIDRLTFEARVDPCAAHQALVELLVERIVANGHEGCAGRLIDRMAIDMARRQRAQAPQFDS